jgi:hypothetical protein
VPFDDPFVDLLDEARHGEAVRSRTRRRWLDQQRLDEGGFVGTLLDLADRAQLVVVRTEAGRTHQAYVGEVGEDHCVLETTAGATVVVVLAAVASVRPRALDLREQAVGDRRAATGRTLRDQLQRVAWDRPRVVVVTRGVPELLTGELLSVGRDVVTLSLDAEAAGLCFVPIESVAEVAVVGERA